MGDAAAICRRQLDVKDVDVSKCRRRCTAAAASALASKKARADNPGAIKTGRA